MSSPPTIQNDTPAEFDIASLSGTITKGIARKLLTPVQFVGFWAAVSLPFLYVPLLSGGLAETESTVFVALLAVNVVALVVGHGYKRE